MEPILKAKNLHKSFNTARENSVKVLKDVSISIKENEISLLVGASGAGKSTLLHILSGLDNPDKGEIYFKGNRLDKMSEREKSKFRNLNIGFVFQFHHLLPEFTAIENIAIPKMLAGYTKSDALKVAGELITLVGLENRSEHKPAELSGGEQQRIAVARAIVNNPKIIFADEPTGNLDSENSNNLHQLFIELKEKKGLTFLIVTHNKELVKLADTIFEMKDGKLFLNNYFETSSK